MSSAAAQQVARELRLQTSRAGVIAVLVDAAGIPDGNLAEAFQGIEAGPAGEWASLLRILSGPRDPSVPSVVYGEIGAAYRQRDRPDLAQTFYERALESAATVEEKGSILVSLGVLAAQAGDHAKAEKRLKKVGELAAGGEVPESTQAVALLNLANLAKLREERKIALALYRQAREKSAPGTRVARAASLYEAELAIDAGEQARARELLEAVAVARATASSAMLPSGADDHADMAIYHQLDERLFEGAEDAPDRIAAFVQAMRAAAADRAGGQPFLRALADRAVPAGKIVDWLETHLDDGTIRAAGGWGAVVAALRNAALRDVNPMAVARASCLLTERFDVPDQIKIDLLTEALELSRGVAGGNSHLQRARMQLQLGCAYFFANAERDLGRAIASWKRALGACSLLPASQVRDTLLMAPAHSYLGVGYRELGRAGDHAANERAHEHLNTARKLTPSGPQFEWLRRQTENALANLEQEARNVAPNAAAETRDPRVERLARTIADREREFAQPNDDAEWRVVVLINLATDELELAKLLQDDARRDALLKGASHASAATQLASGLENPDFALSAAALSAAIALERGLAAEALAPFANALNRKLRSSRTAKLDLLATAFRTAAVAASRLGRRTQSYRRMLEGLAALRRSGAPEAIQLKERRFVAQHLLEWRELDRAVFFLAQERERSRLWPLRRAWRCAPGETLLFWLLTATDAGWAVVVGADGVHAREIALPPGFLLEVTAFWHRCLSLQRRKEDGPRQAFRDGLAHISAVLGRILFQPVVDCLPMAGVLHVVPDAIMRSLPLHVAAVVDRLGRSHFVSDMMVVSFPENVTFDAAALDARSEGFFVATHSPTDGRIPFALLEAVGAASHHPSVEPIMNASAAQVLEGLARFDVVHLGCHGVFDMMEPLDSSLRFADRSVTLREIELRLAESPCSVIILSACEAGIAAFDPARKFDFPSVLLRAGCAQVVAARWEVDDVATALLMGVLHQELARGRPAANALADASNWLRTAPGRLLGMLAQTWFPAAREEIDPRDISDVEDRIGKLGALGAQAPFAHLAEWAAFVCYVDRVRLTALSRS